MKPETTTVHGKTGTMRRTLAALVLGGGILAAPAVSHAGVFIGISIAPPALPVYVQPACPAEGYIWAPGFWQWDSEVADYYWVPGTWVLAPQPGYLWTPGYWGYTGGYYGWHGGYWGPHIGFYGGVNYGFGYFGSGFNGGYWNSGHFFYNTAYSHVNEVNVHNTYVQNVTINNTTINRVSYNGGNGIQAQPGRQEQQAMHEHHMQPTQLQQTHMAVARQDHSQFASANHGAPPAAALIRPAANAGSFRQNAIAARPIGAASGPAAGPANSGINRTNGINRGGNPPVNDRGQYTQSAQPGNNRNGYNTNTPQTTPGSRAGYNPGNANQPRSETQVQQRQPQAQLPAQQRPMQQQRPVQQQPPMQQRPPQMQERPPQMQQRQPQVQERPAPAARPTPESHNGGGEREGRPRL